MREAVVIRTISDTSDAKPRGKGNLLLNFGLIFFFFFFNKNLSSLAISLYLFLTFNLTFSSEIRLSFNII